MTYARSQAEKDPISGRPAGLPDMSKGVRMSPDELDALPLGSVVVWPHNQCAWQRDPSNIDPERQWCSDGRPFPSSHVALYPVIVAWTPPPAPAAPWSVISTDRENPTLARVTWAKGVRSEESSTAMYYRNERGIFDEWDVGIGQLDDIESVELLDTYSPESHVLVERALVDEAARGGGAWAALSIVRRLAALADGDEKGAES